MNGNEMLAPCGLECSYCVHFLANKDATARKQIERWSAALKIPAEKMICGGCRAQIGRIPLQNHFFGDDHRCALYACSRKRNVDYCATCKQFPCDKRHPYSEKSELLTKGTKAFLCA